MAPEARQKLGDQVRADLIASFGGVEPPAVETLVRIRMAERVSAVHQIPSFQVWLRRTYTRDSDTRLSGEGVLLGKAAP
jgi:hypothetical protein